MLVKLCGTSGSGKSTVARSLLERGVVSKLSHAYRVDIDELDKPLYILGLYVTECGGCDTLTAGQQIDLIHKYARLGHVFYEGLLGSEYYGKLGEASELYGRDHIFAFLDTPIEECIKRVKQRRWKAGNRKPFKEENTRNRVTKIHSLRMRLKGSGRHVVDIDWKNANEQVYNLFRGDRDQSRATKDNELLDARASENP